MFVFSNLVKLPHTIKSMNWIWLIFLRNSFIGDHSLFLLLKLTAVTFSNETSAYFSAKKQQNRRSTRSSSIPSTYPPKEEPENNSANVSLVTKQIKTKLNLGDYEVPSGIDNFDKENWDDVFQVSHYAMDIFNYLKEREVCYRFAYYHKSNAIFCFRHNFKLLII